MENRGVTFASKPPPAAAATPHFSSGKVTRKLLPLAVTDCFVAPASTCTNGAKRECPENSGPASSRYWRVRPFTGNPLVARPYSPLASTRSVSDGLNWRDTEASQPFRRLRSVIVLAGTSHVPRTGQ